MNLARYSLFLLCLAPFLKLVWGGFHAGLGVNPVEFVEHATGDWGLNFFCVTLAVTPLVRLTGWTWWMQRRRMLGLFVAFYATLHFLTYLLLDMELRFVEFLRDINRRPYIFVGFAAFVLLIPLTITSTDAMIRRLKKWWGRIHTLVYPAAILGVIHYLWLVKSDARRPLRYAAIIGLLLGYRVIMRARKSLSAAAPPPVPSP